MVTVQWAMELPSVANGRYKTEHWAKKARRVKAQRAATFLAMKSRRVLQILPHMLSLEIANTRLAVRLTRTSPRTLDDDNLATAFKAVRDEVASYFGLDDRDPRIRFEYAQAKGKPSSVRIDFAVERVVDVARLEANARAVDERAKAVMRSLGPEVACE